MTIPGLGVLASLTEGLMGSSATERGGREEAGRETDGRFLDALVGALVSDSTEPGPHRPLSALFEGLVGHGGEEATGDAGTGEPETEGDVKGAETLDGAEVPSHAQTDGADGERAEGPARQRSTAVLESAAPGRPPSPTSDRGVPGDPTLPARASESAPGGLVPGARVDGPALDFVRAARSGVDAASAASRSNPVRGTDPGSLERSTDEPATSGVEPASIDTNEATGVDEGSDGVGAVEDTATRPGPGAASLDVETPNRDLENLDPTLRDGIGRVADRMQREFGHTVEVVEGYRTPERQAHLYEKGRSRPGPVVTWTQESRHTLGRAADLRVDGGWTDPVAYGRLQRVAQEEGLVTLGSRDLGHVQLPAEGPASRTSAPLQASAQPLPTAAEAGYGGSSLARVASVASVARAAAVARPAGVAQPGRRFEPGGSTRPTLPDGETPTVTPGDSRLEISNGAVRAADAVSDGRAGIGQADPALVARADVSATAERNPGSSGLEAARPEDWAAEQKAALTSALVEPAQTAEGDLNSFANELLADVTARVGMMDASTIREVSATSGSDMLARVEKIEQLREAAGLAGPGEIRLDLDERDGLGARIRMALRGPKVGAVIDMDDPVVARRMQARISELHKAMEARGLDPVALDVRAIRAVGDAAETVGASTSVADPRRVAAGSSGDRPESDTDRREHNGGEHSDRREFREFRDGSRRDHRRENHHD